MHDTTPNPNAFACVAGYPGVLAEIADLIGNEGADAIVNQYGGTSLYVPSCMSYMTIDHPLAKLLGIEAAQKMVPIFGGDDFDIPKADAVKRARRNALIFVDRAAGLSHSALARKYDLTERQIRSILAAQNASKKLRPSPATIAARWPK